MKSYCKILTCQQKYILDALEDLIEKVRGGRENRYMWSMNYGREADRA